MKNTPKTQKVEKPGVTYPLYRVNINQSCTYLIIEVEAHGALRRAHAIWKKEHPGVPAVTATATLHGTVDYIPAMKAEHYQVDITPPMTASSPAPVLPPHIQRMRDELNELSTKLDKLSAFINGNPAFRALDGSEQLRMKKQLDFMHSYACTLAERITAAKP